MKWMLLTMLAHDKLAQTLKQKKLLRQITPRLPPATKKDTTTVPCFNCPLIDQCGIGQQYSPVSCKALNQWIQIAAEKIK